MLSDTDLAKLAAIFVSALKAAGGLSSGLDVNELGAVIGAKVAEGINAAAPQRKATIGEYLRRSDVTRQVKLKNRNYIENGAPIPEHQIGDGPTDAEFVELLNRVSRSGVYLDGKVTVTYTVQPGGHAEIRIDWPQGNRDQQLDIMRAFAMVGAASVKDVWRHIVGLQEIEAREEEALKAENQKRRLSFGAQRGVNPREVHAERVAAEANA